jgi:MoxR-like ATPase
MTEQAYETAQALRTNIERVVLGKPEVVRSLVIAMLAGDHVLLEDVPGVGKTLAAKALAKSLDGIFTRLQFTPDLLPSDITGSMLYRTDTREFEFSRGPVFANVVLADEINRAPPRTQSALLEAMSEGQVSVDGTTHLLPKPFIVIATQNPFEFDGTYALPESQMDRFLMRISIGYPERNVEREVLRSHRDGEPVDDLKSVVSIEAMRNSQLAARQVLVEDSLVDYLLKIVDTTRETAGIRVGVSTRGALSFYRGCQARAITERRSFVTPDDIKKMAVTVLSHRVVPDAVLGSIDRDSVERLIGDLVETIPVPV